MPILSRRGRLAIAAVVDIALRGEHRPVPGSGVSERLNLAPRHLEPLLQELTRAGILQGARGPRGGYVLGKTTATCGEIVRVAIGIDTEAEGNAPSPLAPVIQRAVGRAETRYLKALDEVTVAELCDQARQHVQTIGASKESVV